VRWGSLRVQGLLALMASSRIAKTTQRERVSVSASVSLSKKNYISRHSTILENMKESVFLACISFRKSLDPDGTHNSDKTLTMRLNSHPTGKKKDHDFKAVHFPTDHRILKRHQSRIQLSGRLPL